MIKKAVARAELLRGSIFLKKENTYMYGMTPKEFEKENSYYNAIVEDYITQLQYMIAEI